MAISSPSLFYSLSCCSPWTTPPIIVKKVAVALKWSDSLHRFRTAFPALPHGDQSDPPVHIWAMS
jgi:hypothetical protein